MTWSQGVSEGGTVGSVKYIHKWAETSFSLNKSAKCLSRKERQHFTDLRIQHNEYVLYIQYVYVAYTLDISRFYDDKFGNSLVSVCMYAIDVLVIIITP